MKCNLLSGPISGLYLVPYVGCRRGQTVIPTQGGELWSHLEHSLSGSRLQNDFTGCFDVTAGFSDAVDISTLLFIESGNKFAVTW